jgi:hypothetical protein
MANHSSIHYEYHQLLRENIVRCAFLCRGIGYYLTRLETLGSSADYAKNHYGWLRSYFTIGISSTFILSQLVLYNTSSVENLWIASGLLGLGYGGMFGLFPTIMIEWFGLGEHFSDKY